MATLIHTTTSCDQVTSLNESFDVNEKNLVKIQAAYIALLQKQKKDLKKKVQQLESEKNNDRFVFMNQQLTRENMEQKKMIESLRSICGFD